MDIYCVWVVPGYVQRKREVKKDKDVWLWRQGPVAGSLCNSGSQHRTRIERVEEEAQCQTAGRGVGAE